MSSSMIRRHFSSQSQSQSPSKPIILPLSEYAPLFTSLDASSPIWIEDNPGDWESRGAFMRKIGIRFLMRKFISSFFLGNNINPQQLSEQICYGFTCLTERIEAKDYTSVLPHLGVLIELLFSNWLKIKDRNLHTEFQFTEVVESKILSIATLVHTGTPSSYSTFFPLQFNNVPGRLYFDDNLLEFSHELNEIFVELFVWGKIVSHQSLTVYDTKGKELYRSGPLSQHVWKFHTPLRSIDSGKQREEVLRWKVIDMNMNVASRCSYVLSQHGAQLGPSDECNTVDVWANLLKM